MSFDLVVWFSRQTSCYSDDWYGYPFEDGVSPDNPSRFAMGMDQHLRPWKTMKKTRKPTGFGHFFGTSNPLFRVSQVWPMPSVSPPSCPPKSTQHNKATELRIPQVIKHSKWKSPIYLYIYNNELKKCKGKSTIYIHIIVHIIITMITIINYYYYIYNIVDFP